MALPKVGSADEELLVKAMGFSSTKEFFDYSNRQSLRLKYLNDKYAIKSLDSKILNEIALNGMINERTVLLRKTAFTSRNGHLMMSAVNEPIQSNDAEAGGDCRRRYVNCLTIAAGGATAGHIACLSVDVTSAGIGAVFCHGAVILVQVAMSDNCMLDYKVCAQGSGEPEPGPVLLDSLGLPIYPLPADSIAMPLPD